MTGGAGRSPSAREWAEAIWLAERVGTAGGVLPDRAVPGRVPPRTDGSGDLPPADASGGTT